MSEYEFLKDIITVLENHNLMINCQHQKIDKIHQDIAEINQGLVNLSAKIAFKSDAKPQTISFAEKSTTKLKSTGGIKGNQPLSLDETIDIASGIEDIATEIDLLLDKAKRAPHPCIDDVVRKALEAMDSSMDDFCYHAVIAAARLRINAMTIQRGTSKIVEDLK